MQTTYIFGHKKPDTDTVCASISYSYLKNKLGEKTSPRVLGKINHETKFVLNHFNVPEPIYLNDVKVQIRNMYYDKKVKIDEHQSIGSVFSFIKDYGITAVPLIDTDSKLVGLVTLKEMATFLIDGDIETLNTSYQNIIDTLKGKKVLKFDEIITGNIMAAAYKSETFVSEINLTSNDILIVGDRYKIIKEAVHSKVKMIIITGNNTISDDLLEEAKKNKVNIITTTLSTYQTANRIKYSNYIKSVMSNANPHVFDEYTYRTDYLELVQKLGHTNYPVVDKFDKCLGMIKVTDSNKFDKKKVILVDHNQATQSADGIEEADILEIIDHHNLGTIGTQLPINFRCMPLGSTCTIISLLFAENKVGIPKDIAGLMLSAILSDTLLLKSPTTTKTDIECAKKLASICGEDIEKYGYLMLKAGSSIKGLSTSEVIYQDYKNYKVNDDKMGISQVITMDFDSIKENLDEYIDTLNTIYSDGYKVVVLFVTDIVKNGSYIVYADLCKDIISEAFDIEDLTEGYFVKDLVSRKKQMQPSIMEVLN